MRDKYIIVLRLEINKWNICQKFDDEHSQDDSNIDVINVGTKER